MKLATLAFELPRIAHVFLEILEDYKRNIKPGTRREHVVNDVWKNNDYNQIQAERREQIKVP